MALPLMPKATAVWLVENTALTFDQIAEFCGMHELEVQAIADGEVATGIVGADPIANGQLSREEIERCEKNPDARLKLRVSDIPTPQQRSKGARYTPVSKRHDRPDAIAWLLKHHPELSDAQLSKLIGTTKPTINAVRDRTHWNSAAIKPRNPVTLGLCSEPDLEKALIIAAPRRKQLEAEHAPEPEVQPVQMDEPSIEQVFGRDAQHGDQAPEPEEINPEDVFESRSPGEE
ncbi:DUF1013 domain-containing protein [Caenispirillum salinarum]|uniref:DUF1013 domain-containing protein n=1 Tax=Caenispirillum salinarum TaxID=859058 RepID=UPI00384BAA36